MNEIQIHEAGKLFEDVQMKNILGDGKTFPDCIPLRPIEKIQDAFSVQKDSKDFDLRKFVEDNFALPQAYSTGYKSDSAKSPKEHIESLWPLLTRSPEPEAGSLISLPHPYIVPGGRFREIYYWDSYFTMLGLQVSKRSDLIQNMVDNFSFLINTVGYIPNGNRTYFIGRSQPPFFSLMVKLLHEEKSTEKNNILVQYLPVLEKEHQFWVSGANKLTPSNRSVNRVVLMTDGSVLNRYWDANSTPRPEAFKEDVELSHKSAQKPEELFRNLRAAAESGWDFSSRWFKKAKDFSSIHTTDIIPVDLNCLLLHLEQTLSEGFSLSGSQDKAAEYRLRCERRKAAILKFCWNEQKKFFFDYDFVGMKQKENCTLAAASPLFFKIATTQQAECVAKLLGEKFLKPGGLITTLETTGEQWDSPNGWAPLQWISYKGLLNYNLPEADKVKANWLNANKKVYANTGKMTEKYNVVNDDTGASGGEYPNQDGFGWTNGVFLAMSES